MLLPGIQSIKDDQYITIFSYPHNPKTDLKLHSNSFKNYCPKCKKEAILDIGDAENNPEYFDPLGRIICDNCHTSYDGVEGNSLKTSNNAEEIVLYLIPAGNIGSKNPSKTSIDLLNEKINEIEKNTSLKKYKTSEYRGTVKLPAGEMIYPGEWCKIINKDTFSNDYHIEEVKCDIDNNEMELTLKNNPSPPKTIYKPVPKKRSKRKKKVEVKKIAFKSNTSIEKKIMLEGKSLKNPHNIYKWLNKINGTGGWKYKYYFNHIKGGNIYKFQPSSAKYCWDHKTANCVDFAWIFYTMCKGAKYKVQIYKGSANFSGKRIGHMWNKYKGKIIDCSSYTSRAYKGRRIL